MNHYVYPPRYSIIKQWVQLQPFITHALIETHFNLTYARSRLVIAALQRDGVIPSESDAQGRFKVIMKEE
jgi:hypothetical protein